MSQWRCTIHSWNWKDKRNPSFHQSFVTFIWKSRLSFHHPFFEDIDTEFIWIWMSKALWENTGPQKEDQNEFFLCGCQGRLNFQGNVRTRQCHVDGDRYGWIDSNFIKEIFDPFQIVIEGMDQPICWDSHSNESIYFISNTRELIFLAMGLSSNSNSFEFQWICFERESNWSKFSWSDMKKKIELLYFEYI